MSYYGGGYTSYASYASYGASTNYSYNNSYNSDSCYATGNYLNNINNYIQEVRYGSYASQCANWQNTATTVVLWHLLFPAENGSSWQPAKEKTVNIALEINESEESFDCFTEGVLAFLEQIGGKISDDSQEIIIALPDNIKNVSTDFYHGMLAFLIEINGFDNIKSRVSINSPHNAPLKTYDAFIESYEQSLAKNQQKVDIIRNTVSQTDSLHEKNEEIIKEARQKSKKLAIVSAILAIPTAAVTVAAGIVGTEGLAEGLLITGVTALVFLVVALIIGLIGTAETHVLQKKTLDSLTDMSSVIEQLDALENPA